MRKLQNRMTRRSNVNQQQQQQQQCTSAAGPDRAAAAAAAADCGFSSLTMHVACNSDHLQHQQQQQQQVAGSAAAGPDGTAAAADSGSSDIIISIACDTDHFAHQQQQQQQQLKTAGSAAAISRGSSGSSHIHACVILDPIYRHGEVVGYLVQRTYVSPQDVQGAPKLVLKEALGLLKAEGRATLRHGLSPAHNVQPGGALGDTQGVKG
jgi:hypothetical protein